MFAGSKIWRLILSYMIIFSEIDSPFERFDNAPLENQFPQELKQPDNGNAILRPSLPPRMGARFLGKIVMKQAIGASRKAVPIES